MSDKKSQSYLHGAAILAVTVAVVKIFGAVYKIALGNIIGDEGFAHFTVAYNIFSVLLTISTAGLPVAVSKMISEANALDRRRQIKRVFKVATISFCVLGFIGTSIMLFFSKPLAISMGDIEAAPSILLLSPSIFFVCLMSAYRGYTQGHSDMKLTSVSQIIEVLCKVIFGVLLSWLFLKQGLPAASAGAIAGVSIGSVLACLYSAVYIKNMRRRRMPAPSEPDRPESMSRIFGKLVTIAVPVALGSSVLSIINLIDTKLIMNLLQDKAQFSFETAKVLFGVYGKVQTLFNLPSAFIVPLTISIIPAISAFAAQKRDKEAAEAMHSSMKITTLLGLPAAVGLSVLAQPIMRVLYSGSAPEGVGLLMILGFSSYFACLIMITNAILQAYGHERMPIITIIVGGIVKIVLNLVLVSNPKVGIFGAAISMLACDAIISILNLMLIKGVVRRTPSYVGIFVKPVICSAIMGAVTYLSYTLLSKLTTGLLGAERVWAATAAAMAGAMLVAVIVYFFAIILTKTLTKDDMELLPGGKKLAKILKIR